MIEAEAAEVIGAGRYERTASSNMNAAVHTSTRVHRCRDDVPRTSAICLTTQPVAVSWRLRSAGVTAKRVLQHRTTLCDSQVRLEIAAVGGADRRSARNAARPMNQSREAHLATWPLHSPEGAFSPGRFETVHERLGTATQQCFHWSAWVWSPPPESNRRPHPYLDRRASAVLTRVLAARTTPCCCSYQGESK